MVNITIKPAPEETYGHLELTDVPIEGIIKGFRLYEVSMDKEQYLLIEGLNLNIYYALLDDPNEGKPANLGYCWCCPEYRETYQLYGPKIEPQSFESSEMSLERITALLLSKEQKYSFE